MVSMVILNMLHKLFLLESMGSIPACLKEKAILVDIRKLWETCDYKDYILDMFSFNKEEIEKLREKEGDYTGTTFQSRCG